MIDVLKQTNAYNTTKKRDLESRMNIVQYTFMHIFDISRVLCNYRQFGVMPGTET